MSGTGRTFLFDGNVIRFEANDTIAAALDRAGVVDLGSGEGDCHSRYFCGSGTCQGCVVSVDNVRMEACLAPARDGQRVVSARSAAE